MTTSIITRASKGSQLTTAEMDANFTNLQTTADAAAAAAARLTTQGAGIASAATVNLDASTGSFVHITGTTAITGLTLAQGKDSTVSFDEALTLTNGASLILPGGANIVTAAGDTAIFRGEAAGAVRCIGYQKADGTALVVNTGGTYTSPQQVITPAASITLAHGLGAVPNFISTKLICQTGTSNYSAGDVVYSHSFQQSTSGVDSHGVSITADNVNLYIRYGSDNPTFAILDKTTGVGVSSPNANWKAVFSARL